VLALISYVFFSKGTFSATVLSNGMLQQFHFWRSYRVSAQPITLFSKLRIRDKRIMQCVLLLYANPRLRLRQLANIVEELSPSRLGHLFKEETGMCVGDFAREVALQREKALLEDTELSQQQIREHVGIRDKRNFLRAFTKRMKVTPSECRKGNRDRFDPHVAEFTP
jgi:AraC family transcriptional regulator of arabinose operon